MKNFREIERQIEDAEKELAKLDYKRSEILEKIKKLKYQRDLIDKENLAQYIIKAPVS